MKFRTFLMGSLLLVTTAIIAAALAKEGDWVKLGERRVMLVHDHDTIPVTVARGDFRKIQLRVRKNGIYIHHLSVEYSNGAPDWIPISMHIPAERYSRVVDLRGGDRFIRRVDISYRAVRNSRERSEVQIWARR